MNEEKPEGSIRADGTPTSDVWVLDVGGSHATAASVSLSESSGSVTASDTEALDPSLSADALLDAFAAPALRLRSASEGDSARPDRWVVAMPGPFDYECGIGIFEAVGKFDSLRGVSIRSGLASRLDVDASRIHFVNDAVAYALGEWAFGSATRAERHVCITLGTGIGSAFLDRGLVVDEGSEVPPNGWAYLLESDGRPLEDVVSTRAIVRHFSQRTGRVQTVKEIAETARIGDPDASAVLDQAMFALGVTLAPWLTSFAATRLTVGGSMVRSWPVLVRGLTDGLAHGGVPTDLEVLPSALLDAAPVLGAAFWLNSHEQSPNSQSPNSLRSDNR
ncbi:ROK family protein [Microbacterium sp. AK031]|uniref:ROK family protein n=1 Tax=Microbacterium sp. AK031 TaxID=2723076 RepID=UPI0021676B35|nr:ROK family protein [Microbacterium sp. AK031]MCS3844571.1 glucokinase [Microbacterium sp. AK031]